MSVWPPAAEVPVDMPQGEGVQRRVQRGTIETELQRSEEARGRFRDLQAEKAAREALKGSSEGVKMLPPLEVAEALSNLLDSVHGNLGAIREGIENLVKLQSLRRRYVTFAASQVESGVRTVIPFLEAVPQTGNLIAESLRVIAPEGAKLELFLNNPVPDNFIEVVSNVQQFSGEMPGKVYIPAGSRILAVISATKKAGLATIRLEGDLIPEILPKVGS